MFAIRISFRLDSSAPMKQTLSFVVLLVEVSLLTSIFFSTLLDFVSQGKIEN